MPDLDDALLLEFLDLAFDFVCERRLAEMVDPDRILPALDKATEPARVARWQARLFNPQRERLIERGRKSVLTLGAWLPDDVTQTLAQMLGAPARIPRKMVDELVASEQVRENVKSLLQESLSSFVTKALGSDTEAEGAASGASGGRLRGALGWGARAVAGAGRGLMGGLSGELQKQLQDRMRDFVDSSVAGLQQKLAERLTSEDTAKAIGLQRKRAFLTALKRKESDSAAGLAKAPHATIDPLIPKLVAHNVARAEVREAIVAEVRASLEELSKQTIGELLEEAGLRDESRAALRAHGLPLARELVKREAFGAWWARANTAG